MNNWTARKKWAVFAGVPILVIGLPALITLGIIEVNFARAKAEASALGLPLSEEELARQFPVPEAQKDMPASVTKALKAVGAVQVDFEFKNKMRKGRGTVRF